MKIQLIIIFVCFINMNGISQQTNGNKKNGLYIENNGLKEVYYKQGLKDGIFKTYNRKNGKLSAFGEYENGEKTGTWYYFDEKSHLYLQESQIKKNNYYFRNRDDGVKVKPKYVSYIKTYYSTGYIKEEGFVLYNEDIEIDFYKIGTWKYYNEQGILTKNK